jgi:hypothetical protein
VGGGRVPALDVVDAHGRVQVGPHPLVHDDDGDPPPVQALELAFDVADGRDEDAVHPLLLEQLQVAALALVAAVAVGQQHREPAPRGEALDPASEVDEERVPDVEGDQADRGAPADPQLPRGVVAHVPEFLDRLRDAPAGARGDAVRGVEELRDGGRGHARVHRHLLHRRGHPSPSAVRAAAGSAPPSR